MRVALPFLATVPALATARNVVNLKLLGGWQPAEVTDANVKLLNQALSGKRYSTRVGDTRVCYSDVLSVETQVVAGTNYRFRISGCDVTTSDGECLEDTLKDCAPSDFQVVVFEELSTGAPEVTDIQKVAEGGTEDKDNSGVKAFTADGVEGNVEMMEVSEEEKKAIDAWITAEGLNEYGDKATTVYVGGTPFFSERTGTTKDLYDYILSQHADRPWQTRVETLTSFAVTEDGERATLVQGSVAAVLSVLIVVLVGVALAKVRYGRRDQFPYDPIHSR